MDALVESIIAYYKGRNSGKLEDESIKGLHNDLSEKFPECTFKFMISMKYEMYVLTASITYIFELDWKDKSHIDYKEAKIDAIQ